MKPQVPEDNPAIKIFGEGSGELNHNFPINFFYDRLDFGKDFLNGTFDVRLKLVMTLRNQRNPIGWLHLGHIDESQQPLDRVKFSTGSIGLRDHKLLAQWRNWQITEVSWDNLSLPISHKLTTS